MIYLVATLINLTVLVYVLYPILVRKYRFSLLPDLAEVTAKDSLDTAKDEVLRAIKEIDFEYQLGKMSVEDYESLKTEHQNRAIQILENIDKNRKEEKDGKRPVSTKESAGGENPAGKKVIYCLSCGKELKPEFKFCIYCGEPVPHHQQTEVK